MKLLAVLFLCASAVGSLAMAGDRIGNEVTLAEVNAPAGMDEFHKVLWAFAQGSVPDARFMSGAWDGLSYGTYVSEGVEKKLSREAGVFGFNVVDRGPLLPPLYKATMMGWQAYSGAGPKFTMDLLSGVDDYRVAIEYNSIVIRSEDHHDIRRGGLKEFKVLIRAYQDVILGVVYPSKDGSCFGNMKPTEGVCLVSYYYRKNPLVVPDTRY